MINGNCLQCGDPAFLLDATIECSNFECKHFDADLACSLLEEPQFFEMIGYTWMCNSVPNGRNLKDRAKFGPPKGTNKYSKEILTIYGVRGVYAQNDSGFIKSLTIDPGDGILNLIDKDRKKS